LKSGLGFVKKDACYVKCVNSDFLLWKDSNSTYDFKEKMQMVLKDSKREIKGVLRLKKN
jgi:hypothetical protein